MVAIWCLYRHTLSIELSFIHIGIGWVFFVIHTGPACLWCWSSTRLCVCWVRLTSRAEWFTHLGTAGCKTSSSAFIHTYIHTPWKFCMNWCVVCTVCMYVCCSYYEDHLLHPDDWFSLWRMNCRLVSYHSLVTQAPGTNSCMYVCTYVCVPSVCIYARNHEKLQLMSMSKLKTFIHAYIHTIHTNICCC